MPKSSKLEHNHTIFRSKALELYRQSKERDILPRFVAPPVFLALWILLGLLLAGVVVAWLGRVPTYVAGAGVVLAAPGQVGERASNQAIAVVFIPTNPQQPLHLVPGMPVSLQIGSQGQTIHATLDSVEPGILSPGDARQRYGPGNNCANIISAPSLAVTVKLPATFPLRTYRGSSITAQVQVSSQSVLSLLPGLGPLIGG